MPLCHGRERECSRSHLRPSAAPGYDSAGNLITDQSYGYVYDGQGHMCAAHTAQGMVGYVYDAEGNRVAKGTITAMTCDPTANGFVLTTLYELGPNGQPMTEVDNGAWSHTDVYAGGLQVATYDGSGVHFQLHDWLGTRRVQTNYAGIVEDACSSNPYGDGQTCSNPVMDSSDTHFTGQPRDQESGLDFFDARHFASTMGRFMNPDPSGLYFADPTNPQSFNLYSYVLNNPLIFTDPDGLDCIYTSNQSISSVTVTVLRGDCTSDTDEGVYVAGTVNTDSLTYNRQFGTNNYSLNYNYTPDDSGDSQTATLGVGNIGLDAPPDPDQARISGLVQGVAADTKDFTNLINDSAYCVADNYGLTLATGGTALAGAPIAKSALGVGNGLGGSASPYTSALGATAFKAFGANEPKFTGALGSLSKSLTGTARVAGAAGRVAQKAAPWMAAYTAASIAHCVAGYARK